MSADDILVQSERERRRQRAAAAAAAVDLDGDGAAGQAVNARDFGTVADDVADDTTSLQAAIDSLPAKGGVLHLPAGTYRISQPLQIRSNMTLVGDGRNVTTIHQVGPNADAITGVDLSHVAVRDLHLRGPATGSNPTGTGSGINFTLSGTAGNATFYVELTNVLADYFGRDGVAIQTPIVSRLEQVVTLKSGRHGIHLYSSGEAAGTSTTLTSCFTAGSWGAGYRLKQMAYTSLVGCAADANGIGYDYDTCVGITESGCGSEEPYDFSARQAGYTGLSRKVFNSKVTLDSPYAIGNIGTSYWVTNGSVVTISSLYEGSPGNPDAPVSAPTWSLKVDSGCSVSLGPRSVVTPMSLAAGSTVDLMAAPSAAGAVDPSYPTGGEVTLLRQQATGSITVGGSGSLRLAYFTARNGGTFSKLRTLTAGTAAGATPTLCKMGIFSVAANGNLTLLATTANDATMWNASNSRVERPTTASFTLAVGQRYAVGILVVSAAAMPVLVSASMAGSAAGSAEMGLSPRLAGAVAAQSDMPASVTFDLITDIANLYYAGVAA